MYVLFLCTFSGRKIHFENKLSQSIEINGGGERGGGECYEKLLQFCFLYFILKGHETCTYKVYGCDHHSLQHFITRTYFLT